MKIALVGDIHWSETSSILRKQGTNYSCRLEGLIKSVQWVEDVTQELCCDKVIYLGDFFDRSDLRAMEITALKDIKWSSIPKSFLLGNHEVGGSKGKYNSVNVLSNIGEVIATPKLDVGFGYSILFLPYIDDRDKLPISEYWKRAWGGQFTTQEVKASIIVSHNDIKGINYGPVTSTRGFDVDDILSSCDLFFNGHIHNGDVYKHKIINVGNLTGQNFSEDGFKYSHCIFTLDTANMEVNSYANPFATYFYKLDVEEESSISKLSKIKDDAAVVAVRCREALVESVRKALQDNPHIIESRITLILDSTDKVTDTDKVSELANIDHIKAFKDFIIDQLGSSEIINEELAEISK